VACCPAHSMAACFEEAPPFPSEGHQVWIRLHMPVLARETYELCARAVRRRHGADVKEAASGRGRKALLGSSANTLS